MLMERFSQKGKKDDTEEEEVREWDLVTSGSNQKDGNIISSA